MLEWAVLVLIVSNKNEMVRFWIDYRKLDSTTIKDTYPLLCTDEYIDTIGDAEYYKTLDPYSRYWKMKLPEKDWPKTAFVCHAGIFQYIELAVELTSASA